jgi:exosome complex component RRP41
MLLINEENPDQLFREDGLRLDGRRVDELRPFGCKVGVLKNADGSSRVEHGGNIVIAGVYGPREVHPRHMARPDTGILRVFYRMTTFSVSDRKRPAPNRRDNEISKVIREALEPVLFLHLYPNSAIEVYVEIVAANGGTRCAATTAAALALADAGIPMRSLVCGVAAGKANGQVILDCSDKEDKAGSADMPCAVVEDGNMVSLLQFDGDMTPEEIDTSFKYIRAGAAIIFSHQKAALRAKYENVREQAKQETEALKASGDITEESTDDDEVFGGDAPEGEAEGDFDEYQQEGNSQ